MRHPVGSLLLVLALVGCDQQASKKVDQKAGGPSPSIENMIIQPTASDAGVRGTMTSSPGAAVRGGTTGAPKKDFGK